MSERPRIRNVTGGARCGHCERGLAIVGYHPFGEGRVEEVGPCPWCERGAQIEFPQKARPVWGEGGYWQGRTPETVPQPPEGKPLSHAENTLRGALILRRFSGEDVDPCVGIDLPDPARRMALLKRASA